MPKCECGVETPNKSIMYWTRGEWRCPACKKINEGDIEATKTTPVSPSNSSDLLNAVGCAAFDVYQCVESIRVHKEFNNVNGYNWQDKVAKELIGRLKKAIEEYESI